jgi:hypothetical protein
MAQQNRKVVLTVLRIPLLVLAALIAMLVLGILIYSRV